jgi:hypothetical protein
VADVFLSYNHEDRELVQAIADGLKAAGVDIYFDRKLAPGQSWVQELDQQLNSAHVVVVAWSRNSISSRNVLAEAARGFDRDALAPVIIDPELEPRSLPNPFHAVQTLWLARPGGNPSEDWEAFVAHVRTEVARAKARSKGPSAAVLSEVLGAARSEIVQKFEAIVAPLTGVATEPGIGLTEIGEQLDAATGALTRDDIFSIVVVGRFKVGKSTLLNALLGPTDIAGLTPAPLPTDELPCTATLTRLRYAEEPYVQPIGRAAQPGEAPPAFGRMRFEDFHARARIDPDGNESAFDEIEAFEVGWPSTLLRNGVCLIDSPGMSENEARTEIAERAVAKSDAAIVVYRSDGLAGMDELEFARRVTRHVGKVFTLVNLRGSHQMPPPENLVRFVKSRLGLNPDLSLEEQDVFFVHMQDAESASFKRDGWKSEASGLGPVQRRLAAFLVKDRYVTHLQRTVRKVVPLAEKLASSLQGLAAATGAEQGAIEKVLGECDTDLARLRKRQAQIGDILVSAERQAKIKALQSFRSRIDEIVRVMPEKLDARPIPDIGGMWAAGFTRNKNAERKVCEFINGILREELDAWASAPEDRPGLTADLMPIVTQMSDRLKAEIDDIGQTLSDMHARITALDPALKGSGAGGVTTMLANGAVSLIAFSTLGVVGPGGWRGFAGGVAGGIATTIALVALNVVSGGVILMAIGIGTAIGSAFAAKTGREQKLKKEAWKVCEPQIRALVGSEEVRSQIEAGIGDWFAEARTKVERSCEELVAAERQALDRLRGLGAQKEDRTRLVSRIAAGIAVVEEKLKEARRLEAKLGGAVASG